MSLYAVLLGGPITATHRLVGQLAHARVIAADGGMAHAAKLKVSPELWIGDFDSTPKDLADRYHAVPRQTYPTEKDASDGELAITEALRRGATSLILVGGIGGQLDHMLVHVGFLLALAKRGIDVLMTSGHEEAYGLGSTLALRYLEAGTRLSIIPFTDLMGLSVTGVKWPLNNKNIKLGTAQTLANIATGPVTMALGFGNAVVVVYPHE